MFGCFGVDAEIGVSDNCEDKTKLRETDTGIADSIKDEPAMGEPGNFGKDEAADE